MKRPWPALIAVLACSGCLGSSPAVRLPSLPPAARATPSPSRTAPPATLTKAQAAKRYLQIVRPYNTALERFESAAHAGRSWTGLRPFAKRVATTNAAQIKALRATPWPPGARTRATALVSVSVRAGRYWNAAAKATGPGQFQTAVLQAAKLAGKREATALRQTLGLPTVQRS